MVIKFNSLGIEEAKGNLTKVLTNTASTTEQQKEAFEMFLDAMQKEVSNNIQSEVFGNASVHSNSTGKLSGKEMMFFNEVIENGGFKENTILPVDTQERVFDDLMQEHPILEHLDIKNLGGVTEFIYGDPGGAAVWGALFGDLRGQLNSVFRKESIVQFKLTAFIPISNDMLILGPVWVERYVREVIVEAMAVGLERGFVAGTGKEQPIGLLKDLDAAVENGEYQDKASVGTLTFKPGRTTINELKGVVEKLSIHKVNDEEKSRNIAGKVVMVMNPFDSFGIQANATVQNAAGSYVSSLPFNPIQTESMFVPQGKVLFFVKGEYIAAVGGSMELKKYDQTLALEDATLYAARQFATGKPKDNNAVQIYDLDLAIANEDLSDIGE